jgi:hypothetical protein
MRRRVIISKEQLRNLREREVCRREGPSGRRLRRVGVRVQTTQCSMVFFVLILALITHIYIYHFISASYQISMRVSNGKCIVDAITIYGHSMGYYGVSGHSMALYEALYRCCVALYRCYASLSPSKKKGVYYSFYGSMETM